MAPRHYRIMGAHINHGRASGDQFLACSRCSYSQSPPKASDTSDNGNPKGMRNCRDAQERTKLTVWQAIVVGAGPSGLILALLLGKQGIEVEILDAGTELNKQPRAAHYASPAAYELDRAGVLDDVIAQGFQIKAMCWRKIDTTFIAGMSHEVYPEGFHRMVVLPLDQLGEVLCQHIERQPNCHLKWGHNVVKVGQDADKAWVDVETSTGTRRHEADYVLGCDGASSTVRRELFGPEYPGETLDAQIIATNVSHIYLTRGVEVQWIAMTNLVLSGVLRLREIRLLGYQLHRPSH